MQPQYIGIASNQKKKAYSFQEANFTSNKIEAQHEELDDYLLTALNLKCCKLTHWGKPDLGIDEGIIASKFGRHYVQKRYLLVFMTPRTKHV